MANGTFEEAEESSWDAEVLPSRATEASGLDDCPSSLKNWGGEDLGGVSEGSGVLERLEVASEVLPVPALHKTESWMNFGCNRSGETCKLVQ